MSASTSEQVLPGAQVSPPQRSARGRPTRLLVLHSYYRQRGGEDEVFDAECGLLERMGHQVLRHVVDNQTAVGMGRLALATRTVWNSEGFDAVTDILQRDRPDLVHVHNTFPIMSPAVVHAVYRQKIPCVVTLHNFRIFCAQGSFLRDGRECTKCEGRRVGIPGVLHACYRNSRAASAALVASNATHRRLGTWTRLVDAFVAPSEFVAGRLTRLGLPEEKVHVKGHFLDPDPGVAAGPQHEVGPVTFVGRLNHQKGIPTVIEAWRGRDWLPRLQIVGDGELADDVRALERAQDNVVMMGQQPLQAVLDLLGGSSLLLAPFLGHETFGRVVMEAYSRGTPVLTTGAGALQELVVDGSTGFRFRAGDANSLVRTLREIVEAPGVLGSMRVAARRMYEDRFAGPVNYRRLMEIYDQAARSFEGRST